MALRKRLNASLAESGDTTKVSFLPFVCKALVPVSPEVPPLNANFDEGAQELVVSGAYNFGIAAATTRGSPSRWSRTWTGSPSVELAEEISRPGGGPATRR